MNDQKTARATFTRPANTTAYSAGDCVCDSVSAPTLLQFPLGELPGSRGYITNAKLAKNNSDITNALFRLYLYNKEIIPTNDNEAFSLLYANAQSLIGFIDFELTSESGSSDMAVDVVTNINMRFFNDSEGSRTIYGILVAKSAYTPEGEEEFMVELTAERWN